jgi:hypothetical protein
MSKNVYRTGIWTPKRTRTSGSHVLKSGNSDGKEIRFPVILTPEKKLRDSLFWDSKLNLCVAFDLLRVQRRSFRC